MWQEDEPALIPGLDMSYATSDIRVGRNLVRAILDYYQFLGIIPHDLPDALPLHDLPKHKPDAPVRRKKKSTAKHKSRSRRSAVRAKSKISASSERGEIISQFLSNSLDDPSAVVGDTSRREVCGSDSARRPRSRGANSEFGSPSCDRSASSSNSSRSSSTTSQEEDDGSTTASCSTSSPSGRSGRSNSNNRVKTSRCTSTSSARGSRSSSSRENESSDGDVSDGSKLAVLIGPGVHAASRKKKGSFKTNSGKLDKGSYKKERSINYVEYARKKVPHHIYLFPDDVSGSEFCGAHDYPALKGAKPKLSQGSKRIPSKPKYLSSGALKNSGNLSETIAFSYFDWRRMTRVQRWKHEKHRKTTSKSRNRKRRSKRKSSKNSSPSKKFPSVVSKPRGTGYTPNQLRKRNTQRTVMKINENQKISPSKSKLNPSSASKIRTVVFGPELDSESYSPNCVSGWHGNSVKITKSPLSSFKTIAKAPTLLQYFLNPKGGIL
ncbi:hypothetical protein FHG87_007489 [Trinorchestia longiramus]|nr:hypothetical protein FHG87_007489 [Trinorchestia longiramus]